MGVEGLRFRVSFAGVPRIPLKGVIGICRVELKDDVYKEGRGSGLNFSACL